VTVSSGVPRHERSPAGRVAEGFSLRFEAFGNPFFIKPRFTFIRNIQDTEKKGEA
jgi:hypothetical protein